VSGGTYDLGLRCIAFGAGVDGHPSFGAAEFGDDLALAPFVVFPLYLLAVGAGPLVMVPYLGPVPEGVSLGLYRLGLRRIACFTSVCYDAALSSPFRRERPSPHRRETLLCRHHQPPEGRLSLSILHLPYLL
jgi:hypothetical protein